LEDPIGLFFGGDYITEFIETEDRDFCIVVDETVETPGFGEFGGEIKEAEKDGLMSLEDGFIAESGSQMGFTHPCGADENEITGSLEPLGVKELHDFVSGDLGVKGPVEVTESFDAFNPRHPHQVFNPFLFLQASFLSEKGEHEGFFLLREGLRIGEKPKGFP
jgi:hypothetical protein